MWSDARFEERVMTTSYWQHEPFFRRVARCCKASGGGGPGAAVREGIGCCAAAAEAADSLDLRAYSLERNADLALVSIDRNVTLGGINHGPCLTTPLLLAVPLETNAAMVVVRQCIKSTPCARVPAASRTHCCVVVHHHRPCHLPIWVSCPHKIKATRSESTVIKALLSRSYRHGFHHLRRT